LPIGRKAGGVLNWFSTVLLLISVLVIWISHPVKASGLGVVLQAKRSAPFNFHSVSVLDKTQTIYPGFPADVRILSHFSEQPKSESIIVDQGHKNLSVLTWSDSKYSKRIPIVVIWGKWRQFASNLVDIGSRHITLGNQRICSASISYQTFKLPDVIVLNPFFVAIAHVFSFDKSDSSDNELRPEPIITVFLVSVACFAMYQAVTAATITSAILGTF
jgi:hypothetical protein